MSILARDLCKDFGSLRAVERVSFEIGPGTIVGLIGPNGSGKTTILRMLSGFLAPSSGTVQIDGIDLAIEPDAVRSRLGYLPEHLPACPEARVAEFLEFRARLKQVPRRTRRAEIDR